jgi:hypothetical protein
MKRRHYVHSVKSIGRRKIPFDFAQGRLSPGCRRAHDDIEAKRFQIDPLPGVAWSESGSFTIE